jgi:undecaprenyl-diphosphatase
MTILQSIILGIIQGLTEFLPISSSAHLVITPYLLGWKIPAQDGFIFDVLVQLGTLFAVIAYFRKDLWDILRAVSIGIIHRRPFSDPMSRLGWLLVLATLPAVIIGLLFKNLVERAFGSPLAAALFLLGTAVILVMAERIGRRTLQLEAIDWKDALIVGLFQAIALLPGISRSGATISGGMMRKLDRTSAARLSFLMFVPVMVGASALALVDLFKLPNFAAQIPALVAGFITSTIVGYFSIRWLLSYLAKRSLYAFAFYCVAMCLLVLVVYAIRAWL